MPIERNFCARCGQAVTTRVVVDRPRLVCASCGAIFYENPLPVAAAVVLNERREVLLVKRRNEPYQGGWCLPMGFAEMGETIADAALRELKEEAGLDALVLRLLDADSVESDFYGDLLIVTFEMRKTGGEEQAGDDAEEVRYFPLESPPPLPFSSNVKALKTCALAHREGWAIRDSFVIMQANEDKVMLSDELVALIEARADEIAALWLVEVRSNPTTRSYREMDPDELAARAGSAISQFGHWLKGAESEEEVKSFYRLLARERKRQGIPLHELLSSLTLLKKQVWMFARTHDLWERPIDMYRVLELNRRMAAFFDRAMVHAAKQFREFGDETTSG